MQEPSSLGLAGSLAGRASERERGPAGARCPHTPVLDTAIPQSPASIKAATIEWHGFSRQRENLLR
jgi:hypothetical protein